MPRWLRLRVLTLLLVLGTAAAASPQPQSRLSDDFALLGKESSLVFVGTIQDLGTPPGLCTVQLLQSVKFRIERTFKGQWPDPDVTVEYRNHTCSGKPLPPPFQVGARLIVFAEVMPATSVSPTRALGKQIRRTKVLSTYGVFSATDAAIQTLQEVLGRSGRTGSSGSKPGTPLHTH